MKKLLLLLAFVALHSSAQDVIVKKDGSTILSKVIEINTADIKYKKFSNQNGPTYTINKLEILSINYENGEKEDYSDYKEEKKQNNTPSGFVKPVPSPDNSDIINSYNISHPSLSPNNGKKSSGLFTILGVDTSSILADNNIEIIFRHYNYDELDYENITIAGRHCQECDYEIIIANKSNYTVYIDLGNTFRVFNDLSYAPFFNGEQTTISSGGSSGIGLNLGSVANVAGVGGVAGTLAGGITVGGSSTRSHSTTYTKQRIMSIPPNSSQSLGKCQWEHNDNGSIRISSAESIPESNLGIKKGFVKAGETYTYNYENSPYKRSFLVTYSVNMDFSIYTTLKANLYLRTIIGTPKSYSHRTKKLEKDFKETIGNFNSKTLCAYYEY